MEYIACFVLGGVVGIVIARLMASAGREDEWK